MPDNDDIDQRFTALTAQISVRERRRMSKVAEQEWARQPRIKRRRRRRWTAVAVAVLVAAAGGFVVYRPDSVERVRAAILADFGIDPSADPAAAGQSAEPAPVKPVKLSPFDGSPAQKYADGVKGLVMPEPRALGGLSRKEVSAALRHARKLLTASNLDRKVLLGGRPNALIRLLNPDQRAPFVKGLKHPDRKSGYESRRWVTSLAPKNAELVSETFKVHGRTRLTTFKENGLSSVRIKVNYLFVYAIQRPCRPDTLTRLVAHNIGRLDVWRDGGRLRFWVSGWNGGGVAPARCDIDDAFVHPFYPDSPPDRKPTAGAPAVDPYSIEEETTKDCSPLKSST
ncbi:hypothetical protein [Streptosporangium amethystogenes]|uniref:hypothetical protein n=1 Tax=Streptosporangium amethystogenes TaxID=2002 RepID=UPI0004C693A8|nr:hypothetical protein [Streptosporangium amethystogenes]